jgi:DNA polymerase sigma
MRAVKTLPRARVPIVKFHDPISNLYCDICINNELAIENTKLIGDYSKIDSRVIQLGYIIKYWSKQRQINETYQGTLSSYAYILMVIHFLQRRNPPVLPILQDMFDSDNLKSPVIISGFDCYYYNKIDKLIDFGKNNKETIGELTATFFRTYACEFDWENMVISPRTGKLLSKAEKQWNLQSDDYPNSRDHFYFTLEDPFEITHNLGRGVDRDNLKVIKYEFLRAYKLICKNQDLNIICKKYVEGEPLED